MNIFLTKTKFFYIVILCFFYATSTWAQEKTLPSKWELKFTDQVMHFSVMEDHVEVLFRLHAAVYTIDKKRVNFPTIFQILKKAHKNKKTVEVTVMGTDILSLTTNVHL